MKEIKEIEVASWPDFEAEIRRLCRLREEREAETGRSFHEPLFRGLGNSEWGLKTTLERSDETMGLREYYRKAAGAKPAIESLTGRRWNEVPPFDDFDRRLRNHDDCWLDLFLNRQSAVYEYLVYLRHHGFPSPLLDWTASPYIAAFFAFDTVDRDAEHVCIYGVLKDGICGLSSAQHLFFIGPYIQTHPRHYAQQSRYSMCVGLDPSDNDYKFIPHERAISEAIGLKGEFFKLKIPVRERLSALKHLDLMNINPFSLYGTEDSLVRTVARRECLFCDWNL